MPATSRMVGVTSIDYDRRIVHFGSPAGHPAGAFGSRSRPWTRQARRGANPGPAAYGQAVTEPTVTDANLVAGHIPADLALGGSVLLAALLALPYLIAGFLVAHHGVEPGGQSL